MNDASATGGPVPSGRIVVSGPTSSPWLRILAYCSVSAVAVVVILTAVAAVTSGGAGVLSVLFGAAIVVLFFGISLLVGHFVGRKNPSGAIGIFLVTYLVKVVGFAAVLFFYGAPGWLDGTWFFTAAVVTVLLWQGTEVVAFSRTRHQLYNDPQPPKAGVPVADHRDAPEDGKNV